MTETDAMQLLIKEAEEQGQAAVARAIGYSAAAVNQAIKGTYGGALNRLLNKVVEVFGGKKVNCPVLGEINLSRCAAERRAPFAATSPQRTRLFKACKTCKEATSHELDQ